MLNKKISLALAIVLTCGYISSSSGHEIFQDVLKERYTLKSFACKTCHPDSHDRKIRSLFAELVYQELKEKNYSEKFAAAEASGEEAVKAFDLVIAEEFKKVMPVVEKKQLTVEQLFTEGLLNGARLDTKKLAAKAGKADSEDDDSADEDE